MKIRFLFLLEALLLLLALCFPSQVIYANDTPVAIMVDAPLEVYDVLIDDSDMAHFLRRGEQSDTLSVPTVAYAVYDRFRAVECEIVWRYDDFDNLSVGRRMLTGNMALPNGYVFRDQPLTAEVPVIVYDPEGEPTETIASCLYTDQPNAVIPLGTSREDLPQFFGYIYDEAHLTTERGDSFLAPVALNLDRIDTNTAGVYYPFVFDLPGGVTFSGKEFYLSGVHVVADDAVDLRAVSHYQSGYLIQWLYKADQPVLWASVDGGDWHKPENDQARPFYNAYGRFVADGGTEKVNGLEIFFRNLTPGHIYKFQVEYDDQRFSNVIVLDLVNNSLPRATNEQGGDRKGGDRGENTLPPPTDPDDDSSDGSDDDSDDSPDASDGDPPISPGTPDIGADKPVAHIPEQQPGGGTADKSPELPIPDRDALPAPSTDKRSVVPPGDAAGIASNGAPTAPGDSLGNEMMIHIDKSDIEKVAEDLADVPSIQTTEPTKQPTEPSAIHKQTTSPGISAETVDANGVTVSGKSLEMMMTANPEYVSFLNGELRVSLPTAYLAELGIRAADTFAVTLYQTDSRSFTVAFTVNGKEPAEVFTEPFLVSLPWSGKAVTRALPNGTDVEATQDGSSARVTFSLSLPGTYTLTEHADTEHAGTDAAKADDSDNSGYPKVFVANTPTNATAPGTAEDEPAYTDTWEMTALIAVLSLVSLGGAYKVFTNVTTAARRKRGGNGHE